MKRHRMHDSNDVLEFAKSDSENDFAMVRPIPPANSALFLSRDDKAEVAPV